MTQSRMPAETSKTQSTVVEPHHLCFIKLPWIYGSGAEVTRPTAKQVIGVTLLIDLASCAVPTTSIMVIHGIPKAYRKSCQLRIRFSSLDFADETPLMLIRATFFGLNTTV